jgi:hypothetical protein
MIIVGCIDNLYYNGIYGKSSSLRVLGSYQIRVILCPLQNMFDGCKRIYNVFIRVIDLVQVEV